MYRSCTSRGYLFRGSNKEKCRGSEQRGKIQKPTILTKTSSISRFCMWLVRRNVEPAQQRRWSQATNQRGRALLKPQPPRPMQYLVNAETRENVRNATPRPENNKTAGIDHKNTTTRRNKSRLGRLLPRVSCEPCVSARQCTHAAEGAESQAVAVRSRRRRRWGWSCARSARPSRLSTPARVGVASPFVGVYSIYHI